MHAASLIAAIQGTAAPKPGSGSGPASASFTTPAGGAAALAGAAGVALPAGAPGQTILADAPFGQFLAAVLTGKPLTAAASVTAAPNLEQPLPTTGAELSLAEGLAWALEAPALVSPAPQALATELAGTLEGAAPAQVLTPDEAGAAPAQGGRPHLITPHLTPSNLAARNLTPMHKVSTVAGTPAGQAGEAPSTAEAKPSRQARASALEAGTPEINPETCAAPLPVVEGVLAPVLAQASVPAPVQAGPSIRLATDTPGPEDVLAAAHSLPLVSGVGVSEPTVSAIGVSEPMILSGHDAVALAFPAAPQVMVGAAYAAAPVSAVGVSEPTTLSAQGALPPAISAATPQPVADPAYEAFAPEIEGVIATEADVSASEMASKSASTSAHPRMGPVLQSVGDTFQLAPASPTSPSSASPSPSAVVTPTAAPITATETAPQLATGAPLAVELAASAVVSITGERSAPAAKTEPAGASAQPAPGPDGAPAAAGAAKPGADTGQGGNAGGDQQPAREAPASIAEQPEVAADAAEPVTFETARAEAALQAAAPGETRAPVVVRGSPETVANLAAEIARRMEGRTTRFEMALDPLNLGSVQVSLEIAADGTLSARVACERPEAMAELRSRAAELQRALEQSGFDLSKGGLSFEHGQGRERSGGEGQPRHEGARARAFQEALLAAETADSLPAQPLRLRDRPRAGLDVRI